MTELLAAASHALNIAEKIAAIGRWAVHKLARVPTAPALCERNWDFEVRPIAFIIDLTQELPFVEVRLYLINYLSCPLILVELKVAALRLPGGPTLEQVPLVQEDLPVGAKATQPVTCRRTLLDAEVRALRHHKPRQAASFTLVAKARYKRREYKYGPVASVTIEGWVDSVSA